MARMQFFDQLVQVQSIFRNVSQLVIFKQKFGGLITKYQQLAAAVASMS